MSNLLKPLSVEVCRHRKQNHLEQALEHLSDAEIWADCEKEALAEHIRTELVR